MDHDACSEHLTAYVAGDLPADTAAAVSAHLDGCAECTRERVAVQALLSDVEPLRPDERAALHAAVHAAVVPAGHGVVLAPRRPWGARLYPALGAAAVLLVVGVAVFGAVMGRGSHDETTGAEAGADRAAPAPEAMQDAAGAAGGFAGPVFDARAGRLREPRLTRIGRRSLAARLAATAQRSEYVDAPGEAVDALAALAPEPVAEQVRTCARAVLAEDTRAAVPIYGGLGTYRGRAALALGFVYAATDLGPLDRFMIWIWPRGSCDELLDFVTAGARP